MRNSVWTSVTSTLWSRPATGEKWMFKSVIVNDQCFHFSLFLIISLVDTTHNAVIATLPSLLLYLVPTVFYPFQRLVSKLNFTYVKDELYVLFYLEYFSHLQHSWEYLLALKELGLRSFIRYSEGLKVNNWWLIIVKVEKPDQWCKLVIIIIFLVSFLINLGKFLEMEVTRMCWDFTDCGCGALTK